MKQRKQELHRLVSLQQYRTNMVQQQNYGGREIEIIQRKECNNQKNFY